MAVKIKRLGRWNFPKITIPQNFIDNPPKPEKVIDKVLRFTRESELADILVDENFVLIDGYCSYLIAKQVGVDFVKIKMIKGC